MYGMKGRHDHGMYDSFTQPITCYIGTTLEMPPCFWVDRLAAQQAKRTISVISATFNSSGRLPSARKRLMALPPKMSPAPVVSTT